MSATFACPHCGATYPVKPVLVGRAVRCTKCKNAFKLREDGVADKVEMEAPAAAPAAPPTAAAPAPADPSPRAAVTAPPQPSASGRTATAGTPAPESGRKPVPVTPPSESGRRTAADSADARAAKLTKQQEEARRAMAGTLSNAASQALQAEAVKREAKDVGKKAPKPATARIGAGSKEGTVGKIGPVLVVGDGAREHRDNLVWMCWFFGSLAAIVLVIALLTMHSAPRKALDRFAAPVDPDHSRYPQRLPAMQERAWLSNVRGLVELGNVHIGSARRYDLSGAKTLIGSLAKDQAYLNEQDLYVATGMVAKVAKIWNAKKERAANLEALKTAEIACTTREDLAAQLKASGIPEDGVSVLLMLLLPGSGAPQHAAQRLQKGELPDAMEVAPFSGTEGISIQDKGSKYEFPKSTYSGRVLRFIGIGWPAEWRVLSVSLER